MKTKKKLFFFAFLFVVMASPVNLKAAACEHNIFTQGSGTNADPWLISTPLQVDHVRAHPSSSFKLTRNINMEDSETGIIWEIIPEFTGVLDGNGYTISKLQNRIIHNRNKYVLGFINLNRGTIKNLTLSDYELQDSHGNESEAIPRGGIVGDNRGRIFNCETKGLDISAKSRTVGGIAGRNYGTIEYARSNNERIYGGYTTGGIVGAGSFQSKVLYCSNTTNTFWGVDVGGIVGAMYGQDSGGGLVKGSWNSGNLNGRATVGGIVGIAQTNVLIEDCYNTGELRSVNFGVWNSGIVGQGWGRGGFVRNCYSLTRSIESPNHTVENTYVSSITPEVIMKSQYFVDLLNANRRNPVWIRGDASYPFPQIIGFLENEVTTPYLKTGDNTPLRINIKATTPPDTIWQLVNLKTNEVFLSIPELSTIQRTITLNAGKDNETYSLVGKMIRNGKEVVQSPILEISKANILDKIRETLMVTSDSSVVVLSDSDRHIENNSLNRTLVNEIKSLGPVFIIGDDLSPVLTPLLK